MIFWDKFYIIPTKLFCKISGIFFFKYKFVERLSQILDTIKLRKKIL
jgi:hypothetical protein